MHTKMSSIALWVLSLYGSLLCASASYAVQETQLSPGEPPCICRPECKPPAGAFSYKETALSDVIADLNESEHANLVVDNDIASVPVNMNSVHAPWTDVLRTIAAENDLQVVCVHSQVARIAKKSASPIESRVVSLDNFPEPRTSAPIERSTTDILVENMRSILAADGDPRARVAILPNGHEVLITARRDQVDLLASFIRRVDQPEQQVFIRATLVKVRVNKSDFSRNIPFQREGAEGAASPVGSIYQDNLPTDSEGKISEGNHEQPRIVVLARPFGTVLDGQTIEFSSASTRTVSKNGKSETIQDPVRRLEITPVISNSPIENEVNLDVLVEGNEAVYSSEDSPEATKKTLNTFVRTKPGETVILGGFAEHEAEPSALTRLATSVFTLGTDPAAAYVDVYYWLVSAKVLPPT